MCAAFSSNYIDQSQEFALCAVALVYPFMRLIRAEKFWPALLLGLLSLCFIGTMAFIVASRTAMVTMPVMLMVFALVHLRPRTNATEARASRPTSSARSTLRRGGGGRRSDGDHLDRQGIDRLDAGPDEALADVFAALDHDLMTQSDAEAAGVRINLPYDSATCWRRTNDRPEDRRGRGPPQIQSRFTHPDIIKYFMTIREACDLP